MKISLRALAAAATLSLVSISGAAYAENPMVGGAPMYADKNIVENAVNSKDHTTLVAAVKAAGLVDTLKSPGPFTVFAPTNAAFAALLTELGVTKEQLLANTALLTAVLTYHVVPSRVFKADVPVGSPIATVETGSFSVNSSLQITDERGRTASIMATDVMATNGVIHVVDKVLLPAE